MIFPRLKTTAYVTKPTMTAVMMKGFLVSLLVILGTGYEDLYYYYHYMADIVRLHLYDTTVSY
jgi:hypothetical protein